MVDDLRVLTLTLPEREFRELTPNSSSEGLAPLRHGVGTIMWHKRNRSGLGPTTMGVAPPLGEDGAMDKFSRAVRKAFAGDKELVFNGTIGHATRVVETIFDTARDRVELLTHSLSPECYAEPGAMAAATRFLERGGKLDILIENPSSLDRGDVDGVLASYIDVGGDNVSVAVVPDFLVLEYGFNFMVFDNDRGYRFEDDRRYPIAVVAGPAHADVAKNLTNVFAYLKSRASPLAKDRSRPARGNQGHAA